MSENPARQPLYEVFNDYFYRTNQIYHQTARRLGLSDAEFTIFYLLDSGLELTFSEIVLSTCLPKQTVHSCLKKQLDLGLVHLSGEAQSRNRRYSLSEKGVSVIHPMLASVKEAEKKATDIFSPQQKDDFSEKIRQYLESLSRALADPEKPDRTREPD